MRSIAAALLSLLLASSAGAAPAANDPPPVPLADHATITGEAGMGLAFPGNGTMFLRADVAAFHPLWLTARLRFQVMTQLDLLVGYSLRHHLGPDTEEEWTQKSQTLTQTIYDVRTNVVDARSDLLVSAGLKSTSLYTKEKSFNPKIADVFAAGVQYHFVTDTSHQIMEGYVLWGRESGRPGLTILWHNSLSRYSCAGGLLPLVFGMEAGWVPTAPDPFLFWAIAEVGVAFGH